VPFLGPGEASQSEQLESTFLFEESEFSELNQPGYSELENLAMNIQGMRKGMKDERGGRGRDQVSSETELTDDFWEELLSEGMRDEAVLPQLERRPRYVDT
jgi:heat shock transcription factor